MAHLATLEHDLANEPLARERLLQAQRTTEHLGTLLQGLLEWSRLLLGALELEPTRVQDLARRPECAVQWENLLTERGGTLHVEEDVPPVLAAPGILCQVLGNLVVNAIKHNPGPGPRVEIRHVTPRRPGHVEILVDDSGPGSPDAFIARFDAPRTGRPRTIRGGFGLALTARAVEKLGGEMLIERTDTGGGRVRLRLRAA